MAALREPGRHWGRPGRSVEQGDPAPGRPSPCSEAEKPRCSGHRPRLRHVRGRAPQGTVHSGSARQVALPAGGATGDARGRSCAHLHPDFCRSRGLLGLFIEWEGVVRGAGPYGVGGEDAAESFTPAGSLSHETARHGTPEERVRSSNPASSCALRSHTE